MHHVPQNYTAFFIKDIFVKISKPVYAAGFFCIITFLRISYNKLIMQNI